MAAEPDKEGTAPAPRPIVIVRRRKSSRGGHHGGAWKVAYADFVTAMMALFIVLLILALPTWPYSAAWGFYPSGGLGLLLVILLILLLLGYIHIY